MNFNNGGRIDNPPGYKLNSEMNDLDRYIQEQERPWDFFWEDTFIPFVMNLLAAILIVGFFLCAIVTGPIIIGLIFLY